MPDYRYLKNGVVSDAERKEKLYTDYLQKYHEEEKALLDALVESAPRQIEGEVRHFYEGGESYERYKSFRLDPLIDQHFSGRTIFIMESLTWQEHIGLVG